jgi:hypothetical protein
VLVQKNIVKNRALRLRSLRAMCKCTRTEMANQHGIPVATLQNWETPRYGGVTDAGARRVITVFRKLGVHVSYDWLMQGVGDGPYLESQGMLRRMQNLLMRSRVKAVDHAGIFSQCHRHSIVFEVSESCSIQGAQEGDRLLAVPVRATVKAAELKNRLCVVVFLDGGIRAGYVAEVKFSRKQVRIFGEDPRIREVLMPYEKIWQVTGKIPRK